MNPGKNWRVVSIAASVLFLVGLLFVISGGLRISHAAAGDLFVTTNGTGSACTQADPCSLTTALSQAGSGDTIYVAQGTYTGNGDAVISVSNAVNLLGGWDGSTTTPAVRDPGTYPTTIDGQNSRRCVFINGDIAPTVDGFIITRGNASTAAAAPGFGGGIYSIQADPIITNNKITDNVAFTSASEWGDGGGLFIGNSNGIPTGTEISNNLIANNTASAAYRGTGGGMDVYFSRDVIIRDNIIEGNIAGSIFNGIGGGVALTETSAEVTGNWIEDNTASPGTYGFGGGFYSQNGDITLDRNKIIGNTGVSGSVTFMNSPNITVTNNIIAQNTGGGVFLKGRDNAPVNGLLAHNTIAQNGKEGVNAGLGSPGYTTLTLTNNIISGHETGIYAFPDSNTSLLTATYTLFYDNDANTGGGIITSSNEITGHDPGFVNPAGGDFHLGPASPAIDAGSTLPWLTVDIDNDPRPLPAGGGYDIGADEANVLSVYLPSVVKGSN